MNSEPIAVIACAVLATDLRHTARRLGLTVDFKFLEAGLHERPERLKRKLQAAVDAVSAAGTARRIVIGYGVCGQGTVGIQSHAIPLVLPKVHDCIAMFLGGAAAYRREFARYPGTYYISAGWYREKAVPVSQRRRQAWYGDRRVHHDEIASRYGEDAADRTLDFLNSWQRNYQRAAYIDTGSGSDAAFEAHAREMAAEYGWCYEKIDGSPALFEKMLTAGETTDEILVVPPGNAVDFDAVAGTLAAKPLWREGATEDAGPLVFDDSDALPSQPVGIGLGIDAGGTYTDAVIYDFARGETRCKAKSLTTRWDFTVGIGRALEGLDTDELQRTEMVALSTTLATNAIVEGEGQAVGLLLMPPYGLYNPADYPHEPKAVIPGRLSISGEETAPIDEHQTRAVIRRMVETHRVRAFAVSGFAGAINPDHEMAVKRIIREETGCYVTCGHELSDILNFKIRATTAVLNARIIPRLGKLITDLSKVLQRRAIHAPIVVVKGDGTLMGAEMARERPVETIFSGPAASVAGARHLTGADDALVVDMGGTTTDTAAVAGGAVRVCAAGAVVAGRRTHVRALDIRTTGLGGDSLISRERGEHRIGPRRVAPLAWLGTHFPGTVEAIDYLSGRLRRFDNSSANMQLLALTGAATHAGLSPVAQEVIALLQKRPRSIDELVRLTGALTDRHLDLQILEEHFIVQRCGLTPTDLLHLEGAFRRWDTEAVKPFFRLFASLGNHDEVRLRRDLIEQVARRLSLEILKRQLDDTVDPDALDTCPVCRTLLDNLFGGGDDHYRLHVDFKRPIIGIGAPISFFLPRAAAMIGARAVLPEHADVANAIGAITSDVVVDRQVRVVPGEGGGFLIEGIPGARRFKAFEAADHYAKRTLVEVVRRLAGEAGTSARRVTVDVEDQLPEDIAGNPIFIGRILRAHLSGPPDRLAV